MLLNSHIQSMMAGGGGGGGGGGGTDPNFSDVILLAGFDRAGTASRLAYTEESPLAQTVTFSGSGASGTYETGGVFDDNGRLYLSSFTHRGQVADSANVELGSDPFTIEGWFKFDSTTSNDILLGKWGAGGDRSWYFLAGTSQLIFYISTDGSAQTALCTSGWTSPNTTEYFHIAVDYDGTAYRTYVNGVMQGKTTASYTIADTTAPIYLGYPGGGLVGSMDEVRITKGVARYADDAGFTPPTGKFPRS